MSTPPTLAAPPVQVPPHPQWPALTADEKAQLTTRIKTLLTEQQAVLVAHYYTDPDLQALAEETGGCVADSLEMARFGAASDARTLVVCGVRFMGETAKILNPEKRGLAEAFFNELKANKALPSSIKTVNDLIVYVNAVARLRQMVALKNYDPVPAEELAAIREFFADFNKFSSLPIDQKLAALEDLKARHQPRSVNLHQSGSAAHRLRI